MNLFKVLLYITAILSSLACTVLLFRGYGRRRIPLMKWSAICFAGLTHQQRRALSGSGDFS